MIVHTCMHQGLAALLAYTHTVILCTYTVKAFRVKLTEIRRVLRIGPYVHTHVRIMYTVFQKSKNCPD